MFTGFEDMEAVIGELQNEIEALKADRDEQKEAANKYTALFNAVYDQRDELKKEVTGLKDLNHELREALTTALDAIEQIGSLVEDKYRVIDKLTPFGD